MKKIFKFIFIFPMFVFASMPILTSSCAQLNNGTNNGNDPNVTPPDSIDEIPVTDIDKEFSKLSLGKQAINNMNKMEIFINNFGFFGGSDFSYDEFSIYKSNGFRTLSSLFDDYAKSWAPYNYGNSNQKLKMVYGKRTMFDFTKPKNTIVNILKDFDNQTLENKILNVVYQLDAIDINDNNKKNFEQNLKILIDKSLALSNNNGIIIIKDHWQTRDANFNLINDSFSQIIKKVINDNYKNDQNKLDRICFVNHNYLSKEDMISVQGNFVEKGLDENNQLTIWGQFELFVQFLARVYPNYYSYSQHFSPSSFEKYQINHDYSTLVNNNYLQPIEDEAKVNNFQKYINSLTSAKWSFIGDSLSYAGVHTKGYNGYNEHFRWLIRNEYNRPNDLVWNQSINGNLFEWEVFYKDYNFSQYNTDVLSVLLGTNDVTAYYNNDDQWFINTTKSQLNDLYNQYKAKNPNGWIILNTIPYRYNNYNESIMNQKRDVMNKEFKSFAALHNDVIFNDVSSAFKYIISTRFNNDTNITNLSNFYSTDRWHFNTTGHLIITKTILHSLGYQISEQLTKW